VLSNYVQLLSHSETPVSQVESALNYLLKVSLSTALVLKSGVGKTVMNLKKAGATDEIRSLAGQLIQNWSSRSVEQTVRKVSGGILRKRVRGEDDRWCPRYAVTHPSRTPKRVRFRDECLGESVFTAREYHVDEGSVLHKVSRNAEVQDERDVLVRETRSLITSINSMTPDVGWTIPTRVLVPPDIQELISIRGYDSKSKTLADNSTPAREQGNITWNSPIEPALDASNTKVMHPALILNVDQLNTEANPGIHDIQKTIATVGDRLPTPSAIPTSVRQSGVSDNRPTPFVADDHSLLLSTLRRLRHSTPAPGQAPTLNKLNSSGAQALNVPPLTLGQWSTASSAALAPPVNEVAQSSSPEVNATLGTQQLLRRWNASSMKIEADTNVLSRILGALKATSNKRTPDSTTTVLPPPCGQKQQHALKVADIPSNVFSMDLPCPPMTYGDTFVDPTSSVVHPETPFGCGGAPAFPTRPNMFVSPQPFYVGNLPQPGSPLQYQIPFGGIVF
jgi:hypothetical protein